MSISGALGATPLSSRPTSSGFAPLTGEVDPLRTRIHELQQPVPWLQFYEISTPTTPVRLVDFYDPNTLASPGQVRFDGDDYTMITVTRRNIVDSAEGDLTAIGITVVDPDLTILSLLRANDALSGETVTIRLIPYDMLDVPSRAITRVFRVVGASASSDGPTVTLVVGLPDLFKIQKPSQIMTRTKCFSDYPRRHERDNLCRYPSDEFELSTAQEFRVTAGNLQNQERLFGWFTQNADRVSAWKTFAAGRTTDAMNASGNGAFAMRFDSRTEPDTDWNGSLREGPFCYKLIEGSNGDFDVYAGVDLSPSGFGSTIPEWRFGIMFQDPVDETQWSYFCVRGEGVPLAPKWQLLSADTESSVTTTVTGSLDVVNLGDMTREIRMEKSGNTIKLYDRPLTFSPAGTGTKTSVSPSPVDTSGWTLFHTINRDGGLLNPASGARVGLVLSSPDSAVGFTHDAESFYFRFLSGGHPACPRDIAACTTRRNTDQFNGFTSMPSERLVRF